MSAASSVAQKVKAHFYGDADLTQAQNHEFVMKGKC